MLQPLLILGAGHSGMSAAKLAAAEGRGGWLLSDQTPPADHLQTLASLGFCWQSEWLLPENAEVIVSPGIPIEHPWLQTLRSQKVPYKPEFEWATSRLTGQQIAITGSLGKTSMVMLAAELLQAAGYSVTVSGNIGKPVSEIALTQALADFHVIELSSFQLESTRAYRPDIGICLNLFPNHLDRHGTMARYAEAKARLFRFQAISDLGLWPSDYPVAVETAARRGDPDAMVLPALAGSIFAQGPLRRNLQFLFAGLSGIPGMDPAYLADQICAFRFPPHRMEWLKISGAGQVIDDSKSTCLSATKAALESVSGQVQLVMGGLDKAEDLDALTSLFAQRKPSLYLYGHAAKKMAVAWQDSVDLCRTFDTLDALLPALWSQRSKGQILLFSPGCASFDQFPGYVVRGNTFQQLITQLAAQTPIL